MSKKYNRKPDFTVTIHDCEVQTFRAGGKGGQNQNKVESGVRIIHHPSGARGECRETRSQLENKKRAFVRMAESVKFQTWIKNMTLNRQSIEEKLNELMSEDNLKFEVFDGKKWVELK